MSDFIPPLISSSPPPMPDFDDDDEDDDVEFGIGIGSGIVEDLDFSVPVDGGDNEEKKDKIIEVENRRLEINRTSNWKCEEQDSTSQDSGLCMASQSSEGMSPLPQSDDEEKCHQDDSCSISMKHSSTVMFNPEEPSIDKNSSTIAYNIDTVHENNEASDVLPTDTGQNNNNSSVETTNMEGFNNENDHETNFTNESDFDSEFIWGSTFTNNDDLFQDLSQINGDNNSAKIPDNVESVENCEVLHKNGIDSFHEIVFNNLEESSVSRDCLREAFTSSLSINNESADVHGALDNLDNNLCDNSNSINDEKNEKDCNDFDDDDFGNFSSVTIPSCDSIVNNSSVVNFISNVPKSDETFKDNVANEQCDNEFSIKHSESDLECKAVGAASLENNIVNKSEGSEVDSIIDNCNIKQVSDESSVNFVSCDNLDNDGDDDFDDFSDFTQSSNPPLTHEQPCENISIGQSLQDKINTEGNLEIIFPKSENEIYSDITTNDLEGGPVWKHLCPLENSPALTFQWSNSQAHNKLLTSLSIDSRNILFGPHWNVNMPRFAANLGTNPLQPIKAAETQSVCSASPVPPSSEEATVVPDAHFDWVGSGLTNPLDCVTEKANSDCKHLNDSCKSSSAVGNLKLLCNEAESIISSLPDLNFMKKTYIEILISKG